MSNLHAPSRHRGVTLVEVIVVIAIIALAFLFLLMMVPRGREQARLASCTNNLRQIGMALAIYDQLHQQLPAIAALYGHRFARRSKVARPAPDAPGNIATARPDGAERSQIAPAAAAR